MESIPVAVINKIKITFRHVEKNDLIKYIKRRIKRLSVSAPPFPVRAPPTPVCAPPCPEDVPGTVPGGPEEPSPAKVRYCHTKIIFLLEMLSHLSKPCYILT